MYSGVSFARLVQIAVALHRTILSDCILMNIGGLSSGDERNGCSERRNAMNQFRTTNRSGSVKRLGIALIAAMGGIGVVAATTDMS